MSERSTDLIHHGYQPPAGFEAPTLPVHKASTVFFPNVQAMRERRWDDGSSYTYGTFGTPTTYALQSRIATLEGARHCLLTPSGLAAIAVTNLALLQAGDEVLLPDNVYRSNKALAQHELARAGVTLKIYDAMDADSLARAIGPKTRLLWLEAAGSVTLEFPDLRRLLAIAREVGSAELTVALDNTWGAGIAFNAFDLGAGQGVDLTVHALTKYPSGGGDVLMGAICCVDDALHQRLAWTHARLGQCVAANDAELVLRSLPSLELRYAAHDASARALASWCLTRGEFARVMHPALPNSAGHAHWRDLCHGAAGLVAVEFQPRYASAEVDAFVDRLRLFRIGYSWAGPVSLVVPYNLPSMRALPSGIAGVVVRFSAGLEGVADLIADLEQALSALPAPR